jgi:DNA-binding SARP family transcriptional activator
MDFRILGPVELRVDGRPADLGPLKQRTVLAALLIDVGRPVTQELLIERVWDDAPPAEVRNALYTYATRLRRILASVAGAEAARLVRRSGGYLLDVPPETVDAHRFAGLAAGARAPGLTEEQRSELARQALDESGAVPLADLTCRWAGRAREQLSRRRREVLTLHAALEIRLGRAAAVVEGLHAALAEAPLAEDLAATLMSALYFAGRSSEALNVFAETRSAIAAELGVEPGSDLRAAHEGILRGSLAPPVVGAMTDRAPTEERPGRPSAGRIGGRGAAAVTRLTLANVVPSMLPADTPFHAGRDAEVADIIRELTHADRAAAPVVALVGASGLGKSALAIHVAHQLKPAYADGQLYVDLRGLRGPHALAAVLGRFLRALGAAPEELPSSSEELVEIYRGLLADRSVLVVLDGAEDEALVAPLLPPSARCGMVLTGCSRLAGIACRRIVLDVLDEPGALRLLAAVIGPERVRAEPEAARTLTEMCGRMPLAVRIAGARLEARPHWPISVLVARLTDERRRLDELAHGQLDVREALGQTYRGLGQHARVLFRQLGRLDAEGFGPWLAPPLLGVDPDQADEALDQLVDAQVIDVTGRDRSGRPRYRFGHLARLYARDRAAAEETDGEAWRIAALPRDVRARLAAERTRAERTRAERTRAERRRLPGHLLVPDPG